jgi:hypothetical protein
MLYPDHLTLLILEDADPNALNQQVQQLIEQGKYREAIPIAERKAEPLGAVLPANHVGRWPTPKEHGDRRERRCRNAASATIWHGDAPLRCAGITLD